MISPSDFELVRALVLRRAGLSLDEGKRAFVTARLQPLAEAEGAPELATLLSRLRRPGEETLQESVVLALLVHETRFFRDQGSFEAMKSHLLPAAIRARGAEKSLSIWCGACSTGQEPYSVAMLIRSSFPELARWQVKILATDLSAPAIARARLGRYSALELTRGLPGEELRRHVLKRDDGWQIAEPIRRLVEFRELNLATRWPALPPMDLVLLRNVIIYFAEETRRSVFAQARALLKAGGGLLLGSGESPLDADGLYPVPVGDAVVFKVASGSGAGRPHAGA